MIRTTGWIVVRTKPACEFLASRHLRLAGFRPYLPVVWERALRRRMPLFACYEFVQIVVDSWAALCGITGVHSVLTALDQDFAPKPVTVPAASVEAIMAMENKNGVVVLPAATLAFERGDCVRVVDGPLQGHEGLFDGMSASSRCRVLMSILGQETKVCVSEKSLEAA